MVPRLLHHVRSRLHALGLLLAVLALAGLLAPGTTAPGSDDPPVRAQVAALAAAGVLCHGEDESPAPSPQHHGCDHALCLLNCCPALPGATLASAQPLPTPSLAPSPRVRTLPAARAPPGPSFAAAYPRGPPGLS